MSFGFGGSSKEKPEPAFKFGMQSGYAFGSSSSTQPEPAFKFGTQSGYAFGSSSSTQPEPAFRFGSSSSTQHEPAFKFGASHEHFSYGGASKRSAHSGEDVNMDSIKEALHVAKYFDEENLVPIKEALQVIYQNSNIHSDEELRRICNDILSIIDANELVKLYKLCISTLNKRKRTGGGTRNVNGDKLEQHVAIIKGLLIKAERMGWQDLSNVQRGLQDVRVSDNKYSDVERQLKNEQATCELILIDLNNYVLVQLYKACSETLLDLQ